MWCVEVFRLCLCWIALTRCLQADSSFSSTSCNVGEGCSDDTGPCMDVNKSYPLTRHNPIKVGHVQEIDLEQFGKRVMITRAVQPPIFEIPDFLSEEECDFIINKSLKQGLENSVAKGGLTPKFGPIPPDNISGSIFPGEFGWRFEQWDRDKDGIITLKDMAKFARKKRLLYLNDDDIRGMIKLLNITQAEDGKITREEFPETNTLGIDGYFYKLYRLHPKHRDRFSEQTWLLFGRTADNTMSRILKKVMKLTKLPSELVYGGEEMQVVRYHPYGHYHAHYDSETHERPWVPCCHQVTPGKRCKLCRYVTVIYYLNDNFEGGETAFPLADNITLDMSKTKYRGDRDFFNLNEYCHDANLVVKPKKRGTALLWYNHKVDYKNGGWLGELDSYSLHGGCMVTEGEKWIANNWLDAPYHTSKHLPSLFLNRYNAFITPPDE